MNRSRLVPALLAVVAVVLVGLAAGRVAAQDDGPAPTFAPIDVATPSTTPIPEPSPSRTPRPRPVPSATQPPADDDRFQQVNPAPRDIDDDDDDWDDDDNGDDEDDD